MPQARVRRSVHLSDPIVNGKLTLCPASRWSSRGARSAARRTSPSREAKRSTAATAGTRRSPSRKSSPASSRSSATSARTAPRNISIYHSTLKRPCGQLIVVDDGYDLFLTLMLYPNFGWDEPAYHLEGDPEGRDLLGNPRGRRRRRGHRAVGRRQMAHGNLPLGQSRTGGLERRDVTYNPRPL